jgi:hypothetical protein
VHTRKAYAKLFEMYPDAQRQDDEALMAFARSRTDYAEKTQRLAVRTFKAIAGFGNYDADVPAGDEDAGAATNDGHERRSRSGGGRAVGVA